MFRHISTCACDGEFHGSQPVPGPAAEQLQF